VSVLYDLYTTIYIRYLLIKDAGPGWLNELGR